MEGYALPSQNSGNGGPPGFLPEWRSKAPSRLRSASQEDVLNMVGRLELGHEPDQLPAAAGDLSLSQGCQRVLVLFVCCKRAKLCVAGSCPELHKAPQCKQASLRLSGSC